MTEARKPFALTDHERATALWAKLMAHFEARLQSLREKNDSAQLTEAATAALRGEIHAFKGLIRLNTDRPDVTQ